MSAPHFSTNIGTTTYISPKFQLKAKQSAKLNCRKLNWGEEKRHRWNSKWGEAKRHRRNSDWGEAKRNRRNSNWGEAKHWATSLKLLGNSEIYCCNFRNPYSIRASNHRFRQGKARRAWPAPREPAGERFKRVKAPLYWFRQGTLPDLTPQSSRQDYLYEDQDSNFNTN